MASRCSSKLLGRKAIAANFPEWKIACPIMTRMSRLATFFQGADTHLGLFYPTHYMIAIFADLKQAATAEQKLHDAGFSSNEVITVPGEDLRALVQEEEVHGGLFGYLMKEFSRFLHTEAAYTDLDLAEARDGAAVLAAHCISEESKDLARIAIMPEHPLAARYYSAGSIEHLAGEA